MSPSRSSTHSTTGHAVQRSSRAQPGRRRAASAATSTPCTHSRPVWRRPGGGTPGGGTPGGAPGGGAPGGGTPGLVAPTADAVSVSGVTAHEATLASAVSAGSASATWHVEFGPTIAYGQTTAPVTLPAGSPRRAVSVFLSALTGATTYHARVVVTSSAGSAASADSVFTTLADSAAVRVAAAGDIACDPIDPSFNGGAGTPAECQQKAVCGRDPGGRLRRRASAGRRAVQQRDCEPVRGLVQPQLGAFQGDQPPGHRQSRVRHSHSGVLPVLRRRGRRPGEGLLLLRPRLMARDRDQLQLLVHRWLQSGLASGDLGARGPRSTSGELHARLLPPPQILFRAKPATTWR